MSAEEEVDYEEETTEQQPAVTQSSDKRSDAMDEEGEDRKESRARDGRRRDNEGRSEGIKTKGRGHERRRDDDDGRYNGRGGVFERLEGGSGSGPMQSIEGWILFVSNVHPEAQEDDLVDKFSDFGDLKGIHLNLDRRTGFVKGYALIEFEKREEAQSAIKGMDGKDILGQPVRVNWAFVKK